MPFYSTRYCKYYSTCLIKENNNNGIKAGNEKISSLRKSPVSQYGVVVHIISLATYRLQNYTQGSKQEKVL